MPTGFLARRPVPSFRSEFLEAATEVALFDSCVVCFKGDTVTGLAFAGPAEFAMGSLVAMGVPYEQAVARVQLSCADLYDVPLARPDVRSPSGRARSAPVGQDSQSGVCPKSCFTARTSSPRGPTDRPSGSPADVESESAHISRDCGDLGRRL